MRILAIETSCDETSMALVDIAINAQNELNMTIHSHFTASQAQYHAQFGGVFPAMAKLEHIKACVPLLHTTFMESKISISEDEWAQINLDANKTENINKILHREIDIANGLNEFCKNEKFPKIDLICVTNGPGLEPALYVGINFARALSEIMDIPVVGINHMLGHLYSSILPTDTMHTNIKLNNLPDHAIALLVSGGHTELIELLGGPTSKYKLLGATVDDAVGEAYDKVARLMGLSYPGGPLVAKLAEEARKNISSDILKPTFPRPMLHSKNYDFSYSGLKTAVMYYLRDYPINTDEDKMALALAFEEAAIEVLVKKTNRAMEELSVDTLLVGGGVSANNYLRSELQKIAEKNNFTVHFPLQSLTGDNALMIAIACGIQYLNKDIINQKDTIVANGMLSVA
jgi:N6-L-threonylcarbamoyladenine synthase